MPGTGAAQAYEPTSRSQIEDGTVELAGIALRESVVFSFDGTLAISESEAFEPMLGATRLVWKVLLRTAGTTESVISLKLNDTEVAAISIPASVLRVTGQLDHTVNPDSDRFVVGITTAGAGAAKLTLQLYLL